MQIETLTQLKQQIVALNESEKQSLAKFLAEELKGSERSAVLPISDEIRRKQIDWLKENREQYAGKYVALDDNGLVGEGASLSEAREDAAAKGFRDVFVTYVYSENDAPFGGW